MVMRIGNNNMKEGPQQTIFDSMEESTLHNYKLSADELKQELVKFVNYRLFGLPLLAFFLLLRAALLSALLTCFPFFLNGISIIMKY